ncbi:MAG: SEC-C domain-containing protein [Deltaproteobacteria bacterium]|nr:SEC-C domain-containing protein [Deltaproteobacteria bacterium]
MTSKPGRNAPCPCGSGLKFKRCCMSAAEAAPRFTQQDRDSALGKLELFTEVVLKEDDDCALDEFWGRVPAAHDFDEERAPESEAVLDMWFWFDRPLDDGRLVVDRLLAEDPSIAAGERRFLEAARGTCMRLYEVEDTRPGVSVTLREVLDDVRVTVHERMGSRHMKRSDLLAARVISRGVSGQPEIERGLLQIPGLLRDAVVLQASSWRARFRKEEPGTDDLRFFKELPPAFHEVWANAIIAPPIPHLRNTDGEDLLATKVHFEVTDPTRLVATLDASRDLQRASTKETRWHWMGTNRSGESVILGLVILRASDLVLETNSVARGERGRAALEELAGDAVAHRATTHEDLTVSLRQELREGREERPRGPGSDEIPADVMEDIVLEQQGRHYRRWVDEPVPALEGRTPRQAAKDPELRSRAAELVRSLEGMYDAALARGEPAYDPSWMWGELGLARSSQPEHPPPLAHERWDEAAPGFGDLVRSLAERLRKRPGFDDTREALAPAQIADGLGADLDVRRFLKAHRESRGPVDAEALAATDWIPRCMRRAVWFELHLRKTFWVDEPLAYMLAHTDLDVAGRDLRVPFPSFALVFTDRQALSLAERLVAADRTTPLTGYILRVLTVYVTEERTPADRVLHVGLAPDAMGADPPPLIEHRIRLTDEAPIAVPGTDDEPRAFHAEGDPVPSTRPLPLLLRLVVNAILYATSAGAEPEERAMPRAAARRHRAAPPARPAFSSESVYFLPGAIEISQLRRLQDLQRIPSGRQLFHRFMVRGHWRRPRKDWKDRRLRWIEPYWKGPDLAAVIERTYKLTP